MSHQILSFVTYFTATIGTLSNAYGQQATYHPLGTWIDPEVAAFRQWDTGRQAQTARSLNTEARPQLAGLRSRDVELLEDAFLRKHPKLLKGSPSMARMVILRRFATRNGLNTINGSLAESAFVEKNPDWGYVGKPNAPQHDVYRWVAGRKTPFNGQVKFYEEFSGSRYAVAMRKDSTAHRFFIPDDHVEPMKAYIKGRAEEMASAGNQAEAKRLWRDYGRVRPIGATTGNMLARRQQIQRELIAEKSATYVSLGASLALASGSTVWDWASGNVSGDIGLYRATRTLSLLGVGLGTDALLMLAKQGALRGTIKGNSIVGTALTITEGLWLLHEHGWRTAFYEPSFYEEMGGGVSAIGLGLAAGGAVAIGTSEMTPWVAVPGGLIVGGVSGIVGYVGGRAATHKILEIVSPAMLHQREHQQLDAVQSGVDRRIAQLREWPAKQVKCSQSP